jgi:hypothetical protein
VGFDDPTFFIDSAPPRRGFLWPDCVKEKAPPTMTAQLVNGLYKAEIIHRRGPWRSLKAVEFATLEWVDWFNNRRLLEPIGNVP